MALKQNLAWAGLVFPALPIILILNNHYLPPDVRRQTTGLAGEWKVQTEDNTHFAQPETPDADWKTLQLPGGLRKQGIQATTTWFRKWVELPSALEHQDLFMTLGDTRSGVVRVFVNGHYIGDQGEEKSATKVSTIELVGWSIPQELVHPGKNLIALRVEWLTPGYDGIHDPRFYLGVNAALKPRISEMQMLDGFLSIGPPFFSLFLVLALLLFLVTERTSELRRIYVATIVLLIAASMYITLRTGTLFSAFMDINARVTLVPAVIFLTVGSFIEFYDGWNFRRVTRLGRLNQVSLALIVLVSVAAPLKALYTIYPLFVAYLSILLIISVFHNFRGWIRKEIPFSPILASQTVFTTAAWLTDLLTDLQILHMPRMSTYVMANVGIAASVVVMGDFFRISGDNKKLATSLGDANLELAQALVAAKESSRLKGEFFANVSHELRTPLNSIINVPQGLLQEFLRPPWVRCRLCGVSCQLEPNEVLEASTQCPQCQQAGGLEVQSAPQYAGVPEDTLRYLEIIERNGRHLLSVVNQILDASNLEAGRMEIDPGENSLRPILENVHASVSTLAAARNIVLEFPNPLPDFRVHLDAVKVTQLLINLFSNAVRFSPDGAAVTVDVVDEGTTFLMKVIDRGIGIAPENHKLIFETFRQVEGGHTRKFGGTGLGLAIAKKLVLLHQGQIWLESAMGQGTTFFVRMPKNVHLEQPAVPPPVLEQSIIVAVDDDPMNLETIRLALRRREFQIIGVSDPRVALRTISELEPKLVILRGTALVETLKAAPNLQHIPVLVMGAQGISRSWKADMLMKEIDSLLAKPVA